MRHGTTMPFIVILLCCASRALSQEPAEPPPKPLKVLVKELESRDLEVRESACGALVERACRASELPLNLFSDDEVAEVQRFRREARPLIPDLIKLLNSQHTEVRGTIVDVLASLGRVAEPARPALLQRLRNPKENAESRMHTGIALLHVTPSDQPVGPELLAVLGLGEDALPPGAQLKIDEVDSEYLGIVAGTSANWLMMSLCASDRVLLELPSIIKLAQSGTQKVERAIAIETLGKLGVDAISTAPALWKLLDDPDADLRKFAAAALLRIERNPADVPALIKRLQLEPDELKSFQEYVKEYFDRLAKDRAPQFDDYNATDHISNALNHGNGFYRRYAIRELAKLTLNVQLAVIPEVIPVLVAEDPLTRNAAYEYLQKTDPGSLP